MSHFNQPNIGRKNCVWTTKYMRLLEMRIVQHVEMKSVYISTNKTISFYDCKKCKACCHVLSIPFKDQKPTIMLLGGDGTHCLAKKTSPEYGKEKPSPFLRKFLRQSQPSTSEPEPKKQKLLHLWHNRVDTPLVDTVNQNFIYILIYTLSVYIKAT